MFTAVSENAVKTGQFAFKLSTHGSSLYIGGADTTLYTGSIEFHPVQVSQGVYALTGASARVGGAEVASGITTIIDSGTSLMAASPSVASAIYAQVPGRGRRRRAERGCIRSRAARRRRCR